VDIYEIRHSTFHENNSKKICAFQIILFNFIVIVNYNIILATMNKFNRVTLKMRILKLAVLRCTGAPAELALRFDISERSVKRIVKEIRDEGINITYSPVRRSYVTDKNYH
jgi:hypothetical protein